jgi:hypothetical protein
MAGTTVLILASSGKCQRVFLCKLSGVYEKSSAPSFSEEHRTGNSTSKPLIWRQNVLPKRW